MFETPGPDSENNIELLNKIFFSQYTHTQKTNNNNNNLSFIETLEKIMEIQHLINLKLYPFFPTKTIFSPKGRKNTQAHQS